MKKTRKRPKQAIEQLRSDKVTRRRAKTFGKPAWRTVHEAFAGNTVFPTDVALLVGCDLPYACRVLQRLVKLGLARKTGGLRTPYRIFTRRQQSTVG